MFENHVTLTFGIAYLFLVENVIVGAQVLSTRDSGFLQRTLQFINVLVLLTQYH